MFGENSRCDLNAQLAVTPAVSWFAFHDNVIFCKIYRMSATPNRPFDLSAIQDKKRLSGLETEPVKRGQVRTQGKRI
jgi:hypothetical protein